MTAGQSWVRAIQHSPRHKPSGACQNSSGGDGDHSSEAAGDADADSVSDCGSCDSAVDGGVELSMGMAA